MRPRPTMTLLMVISLSSSEESKSPGPISRHARWRPVVLRRAGAKDAAAVAQVLRDACAEYQVLYTPGAYAATTPGPGEIIERLKEGPLWIARNQQRALATASGVPRQTKLYIRSMAVIPQARGLRLGHMLLEELEHFARSHGLTRVILSTTPFLTRAIKLHERYGFREISDGPHDLAGTPLLTMSMDLMSK